MKRYLLKLVLAIVGRAESAIEAELMTRVTEAAAKAAEAAIEGMRRLNDAQSEQIELLTDEVRRLKDDNAELRASLKRCEQTHEAGKAERDELKREIAGLRRQLTQLQGVEGQS